MKIARTYVLALLASLVLFVSAYGYFAVSREIARYEAEVGESHAVMGRVLRQALVEVLDSDGEDRAAALLRSADRGIRRVDIRWVRFDPDAEQSSRPTIAVEQRAGIARALEQRVGGELQRMTVDEDGTRRLTTYVSLAGTPAAGAIELSEAMGKERELVGAAMKVEIMAASILALATVAVATVLGVVLIGRPLRTLILQARRIGAGDLSRRLSFRGRDEVSELAREMDAMCDRLVTALEQLRHADRLTTVGKLASGMAHELGTPLNVIDMRAKMLASGKAATGDVVDAARVIGEQAGRMTRIMRQLLDFARRRGPQKADIELGTLAKRTIAFLEPTAAKRGVGIALANMTAMKEPLVVPADAGQIEQVLTNLVMNAIDASKSGGMVTIELCDERVQAPPGHTGKDGSFCTVCVIDQGAGIEKESLARVFEPFFTTKDVGEGTGLGLSVAYGIVRDHGGFIDVQSEVGRGTRFSVYLPMGDG